MSFFVGRVVPLSGLSEGVFLEFSDLRSSRNTVAECFLKYLSHDGSAASRMEWGVMGDEQEAGQQGVP